MVSKEEVLSTIGKDLNKDNQPWVLAVDGDYVSAKWRWMDATFFSLTDVTDEIKEFEFIVHLKDNGKWKEEVKDISHSINIGTNIGGSFSVNKNLGSKKEFHLNYGIGHDNKNDKSGLIKSEMNSDDVIKPIREYLESKGWKKSLL